MTQIKVLVIIAGLAMLAGCAQQSTYIRVSEPEERLRFSGKGAGAGMMLSSTMGSMGIAIGVAIDEGIAKEIAETAQQSKLSISRTVENAINHHTSVSFRESLHLITIDRYGFVLQVGSNDPVSAQLHISLHRGDGNPLKILFPEDFLGQEGFLLRTRPLAEVKTKASAIQSLFENAAVAIAASLD